MGIKRKQFLTLRPQLVSRLLYKKKTHTHHERHRRTHAIKPAKCETWSGSSCLPLCPNASPCNSHLRYSIAATSSGLSPNDVPCPTALATVPFRGDCGRELADARRLCRGGSSPEALRLATPSSCRPSSRPVGPVAAELFPPGRPSGAGDDDIDGRFTAAAAALAAAAGAGGSCKACAGAISTIFLFLTAGPGFLTTGTGLLIAGIGL